MALDPATRAKLAALPRTPGVYLMKDRDQRIIYVGKAVDLKARIGSYFIGKPEHLKTAALVQEITTFDVILTSTEVEALLLERTLIKHHQPVFNILLRDDKEYPWLRVDLRDDWPRITKVRKKKDDGARYLGPFGGAGFLRTMLDATYRIFPLIRCSPHEFRAAKRPCNYYHMKMCLGPCTLPVDKAVYRTMVEDALAFLEGRSRDLVRQLREKMHNASQHELYELAASYRDQLVAFESITERQAVVALDVPEADAVGLAEGDGMVAIHVLMVREGKIVGSDGFVMPTDLREPITVLEQFLMQYYDARSLPGTLFVPLVSSTWEDLATALRGETTMKFTVVHPQRGPRAEVVRLAERNAAYGLSEALRASTQRQSSLEILKERLKLTELPQRIECIDISNFHETAVVASDVCFVGGKPAREFYRHYTIEGLNGRADDYASIREVVRRRIERGMRDSDLPDLLVIDGGRGQLEAALESAAGFPQLRLAIVGLAKSRIEKNRFTGRAIDTSAPKRSFERVFLPGQTEGLALAPGSAEYRLMTSIRDEAHRFALQHHRRKRKKALQGSSLEEIPGIGPTLRKRLLETFGGLDGLRQASLEQLKNVKGMSENVCVALHAALRGAEDVESKMKTEG